MPSNAPHAQSHAFFIINSTQAYDPNFAGTGSPELVPRDPKYLGYISDGHTSHVVWRFLENGQLSSHFGIDVNAQLVVTSIQIEHGPVLQAALKGVTGCEEHSISLMISGIEITATIVGNAVAGASAETVATAVVGSAPELLYVEGIVTAWCGALGSIVYVVTGHQLFPPTPTPTLMPHPTATPGLEPVPTATRQVPTNTPKPSCCVQTPTPTPTAQPTPVPRPLPPPASDRLCCNSYLGGGTNASELTSQNREFTLVMQADGNLVLYNNIDGIGACWQAAGTYGHRNDVVTMQTDGNLVVYTSESLPRSIVWASNTGNHLQQNYDVILQNDGNLVIYTENGATPLWATGTNKPRGQGGCQ